MNKVMRFIFVVNNLVIKVVLCLDKVVNTVISMKNNIAFYHRHSLHLKGYDYSQVKLCFFTIFSEKFSLCQELSKRWRTFATLKNH